MTTRPTRSTRTEPLFPYTTLFRSWKVPRNWVAVISSGAINAALIAGNPPEHRLERLRRFWDIVSSSLPDFPLWRGERLRELVDEWSAAWVAMAGVPGFFRPRMMPPLLALPGTSEALSLYATGPLRQTLTSTEERRVGNECGSTWRSRL